MNFQTPSATADYNPIEYCLNVIGGSWKPLLILHISKGIDRFTLLQKAIPSISKQVLTNQLRELEADDIILRKVYKQPSRKVEYSISVRGQSLYPVIHAMHNWGKMNKPVESKNTQIKNPHVFG